MGIIAQIKANSDLNENSASGVVCSRDPNSGKKAMFGNFAVKSMGEDIVLGKIAGEPIGNMEDVFSEIYRTELPAALEKLEEKCGYPQEVEFAIEDGKLIFLQTRDVKFTPQGEVRYIQDMVKEGRLSQAQSIPKLKKLQEKLSSRQVYKIKEGLVKQVIAWGETAIPGAMAGRLAFSLEKAREYSANGAPVIVLATPQTREEIIKHVTNFTQVGLITTYGGDSSHEAVLARAAGIPAIILDDVNKFLRYSPGSEISEGDFIAIDGNENEIFLTREKDVLIKDTVFLDATYGIDLVKFEKKFRRAYLDSRDMIKANIRYEDLIWFYIVACKRFEIYENSGQIRRAFIADFKKHFLHELFKQKAKEIGIGLDAANAQLVRAISSAEKISDFAQQGESVIPDGTGFANLIDRAI